MTNTGWTARSERIARHIADQLTGKLPPDHNVHIRERPNTMQASTDFRAIKTEAPCQEDCPPAPPQNVRSDATMPHSRETASHYVVVEAPGQHSPLVIVQIISPADKSPGAGRENYLRVREEILQSPTDLVEIDRSEGNLPVPLARYTEPRRAGREIIVSPARTRPAATLWSIGQPEEELFVDIPLGPSRDPVAVEVNRF